MNANSTFVFSPMLIFLLVGGLIVLSMAMGRKNQQGHRAGAGWWVSLGLLLIVISGFLGYSRLRVSPVLEERHTGRYSFNRAISDMKKELDRGASALQEGMDQARKGFESAEEVLKSQGKGFENAVEVYKTQQQEAKRASTRSSRSSSTNVTASTSIPTPKSPVEWTVEVKGNERRQSKEEVAQVLRDKVISSVNKWVLDRMPIKSIWFHTVDEAWLAQHGVLDGEIKYDTEGIPRLDSQLKDPLYSGAMTVVLSPATQVELLEKGFSKLEFNMLDQKFESQFAIFFILLGFTGLAAILGLVKTMARRRMA